MHRMREGKHPEDIQKQILFPKARLPLPRRHTEKSIPMPRMPERILKAGQNEEPYENYARVLHAQRLHADGHVLPSANGKYTTERRTAANCYCG